MKCRACKQPFKKLRPLQVACSLECALVVGRAKEARRVAQETRKEAKETRARRQSIKTRSQWMREAQAVVNKYVRLRDAGRGCISCGAIPAEKYGGSMDCGHYLSRGASPHLRFNLNNMAAQCVKENRFLGGSAGKFRLGLIERIGLEKVEALEANTISRKFTIEYLMRLKDVFKRKVARKERFMR